MKHILIELEADLDWLFSYNHDALFREVFMLILTRRIGEKLKIGDDITVNVISVKGNQVRLGIQAPNSVPVHRDEIYYRIQEKQIKKR